MSTSTLQLTRCEDAFNASPIPIWILDIETIRVAWANPVALEFWRASTLEELTSRDMLNTAPEAVLVRLRQTIARLHLGKPFHEDWTFFPKGKPLPVMLHLRRIELPDGRLAMLNQVVNIDEGASNETVRTLAMIRHAQAGMVFVDARGQILAQNAGSIFEFGRSQTWHEWIVNREAAFALFQEVLSGKTITTQLDVNTVNGQRTHGITAHALRDPVTGEMSVLIQHFDITERIQAERLVQAHLEKLREQQREILELSTPLLDVGARTLALPLIGRIDELRSAEITSKLLQTVSSRGIKRVILDITGVVSVETANLTFLRRLVGAISLLGAEPIVTGIRSDLARVLAASDENFSGITVKRSLADGLATTRPNRAAREIDATDLRKTGRSG